MAGDLPEHGPGLTSVKCPYRVAEDVSSGKCTVETPEEAEEVPKELP
ncbi:unnamed protein product, partial [marine sediment metagenome]